MCTGKIARWWGRELVSSLIKLGWYACIKVWPFPLLPCIKSIAPRPPFSTIALPSSLNNGRSQVTCSVIPSTSESVHSNHKDVHDRLLLMIMMLRNIGHTGLENTLDHVYKLIHLLTELFINITGAHDSSVTIKKGNVFPETNKRQLFVQKRSGIWPQRKKAWKNENSGTSAFLDLIYWKRSNSHLVSFLPFPSKVTQNYDNEERSAIHRP